MPCACYVRSRALPTASRPFLCGNAARPAPRVRVWTKGTNPAAPCRRTAGVSFVPTRTSSRPFMPSGEYPPITNLCCRSSFKSHSVSRTASGSVAYDIYINMFRYRRIRPVPRARRTRVRDSGAGGLRRSLFSSASLCQRLSWALKGDTMEIKDTVGRARAKA